ncbi:hypothetical protein QJS66_00315 [Kocuria rhizophila]|nr:hypothetical protein QJS66_00315 [Kocuria rhizophila]
MEGDRLSRPHRLRSGVRQPDRVTMVADTVSLTRRSSPPDSSARRVSVDPACPCGVPGVDVVGTPAHGSAARAVVVPLPRRPQPRWRGWGA